MIIRDKAVYTVEHVNGATVEKFYDTLNHIDIDYIDNVLYFSVKDYTNVLATTFGGSVPAKINGDDVTISISGGVGTYPLSSAWIAVDTYHDDMRNGSLYIGDEPDESQRIDEIERVQADLFLQLLERGVI